MKRPILFSGPMVRALLEGRKTQTRRVLPIQMQNVHLDMVGPTGWQFTADGGSPRIPFHPGYSVGDLLWGRETWNVWASSRDGDEWWPYAKIPSEDPRLDEDARSQSCVDFPVLSENQGYDAGKGPWRPCIHMPRWASRLTLKVTDVRVQRLQDISGDDAVAEGVVEDLEVVEIVGTPNGPSERSDYRSRVPGVHDDHETGFDDPVEAFIDLWDGLNKKRGFGWDANPWVVANTFQFHHCNVDAFKDGGGQ